MARELVLLLGKNKSTFKILKIDRKKLYGYKKRVSLDQDGNQCIRANLEEDIMNLLNILHEKSGKI